jgi:CheY-like chemotaxis protein
VRLYKNATLEESNSFDCVFMDISMPVMDGFQASTAIRQFEKQQQCVSEESEPSKAFIFALTGLGSETARVSARNAGCDVFLLKPVRFKDIVPLLSVEA